MKTNVKNIVTSAVFVIFILGVALACILHAPIETSESERRPLEQFPEFVWGDYVTTQSGQTEFSPISGFELKTDFNFGILNSSIKNYISSFEDYSLDQFPLRDKMREIKAFVELKIFGKKDNNDKYIADGYISEMQPAINKPSVENAANIWNNIYNKYLKDKANKVILSVIPDKNYFIAEENGYLAYDYEELIAMLTAACPDFDYVDIFGELSIEDYYKTDTHWRQEQIVDVAKKLADALGVGDEYSWDFKINELDIPFYGVYAGQLGLGVDSETIKYLTSDVLDNCKLYDYEVGGYVDIYDKAKAEGLDPYDFFLSGAKKGPMRIDNPSQDNGKTLVIFRDSFGSSFAPLMVEGYSTVYVVDIRVTMAGLINSPAVVGGFEGKDVLFLASSMVINDSSEFMKN